MGERTGVSIYNRLISAAGTDDFKTSISKGDAQSSYLGF
jgi:hypothetical protein